MRSSPLITATTAARSLRSPLKSLKRSYASRGRIVSSAAGATASKGPRLHDSMVCMASRAPGDSANANDRMWLPLSQTSNNNEVPHVVSRNNSSDEETSSDDEMNSESLGRHSSPCGPVLFRNRPRMFVYKASNTADSHMDYRDDDDDDASSCCSASVISVPLPSVYFASKLVTRVVEIPSHRCYNAEEKAQIWTSLKTLRKEAKRNRIEWQWEGCSFENVAEEHQFLPDTVGNLIHPAHLQTQRVNARLVTKL